MKPLVHNSGPGASPASQPDGLNGVLSDSSMLVPAAELPGNALFEELAAANKRSGDTSPESSNISRSIDWWAVRNQLTHSDDFQNSFNHCVSAFNVAFPDVSVVWTAVESGEVDQSIERSNLHSESTPQELTQRAVSEGQVLTHFDGKLGCNTVIVPCRAANGCVIYSTKKTANEALVRQFETLVVVLSEWCVAHRLRTQQQFTSRLAVVLDLQERISSDNNAPSPAQVLCVELERYFGASSVAFGRVHAHGTELVADSTASIDSTSDRTRALEAAMVEAQIRQDSGIWPTPESSQRHALQCHAQLATETGSEQILSHLLHTDDGNCWGILIVSFSDRSPGNYSADRVLEFLLAANGTIISTLGLVEKAEQTIPDRCIKSLRSLIRRSGIRIACGALILGFAAMFIPVDYTVSGESELHPVSRRYVSAPFKAPLEHCYVSPGDIIEQGQPLAMLDGRELNWELAEVRAELAKATREHDAFLADRDSGPAAIARHEVQRLQNRSALLRSRIAALQVSSPISGIVVAGDLKDSEGVPLESGDALFEVAPLDQLRVEVKVPEDDIRFLESGMEVEIRLDASPAIAVCGRIERIHPQAELHNHDNVFIVDVSLDSTDSWLRPGMRGSASISTGNRRLGWKLFHKPLARTVAWLGW